MFIRKQSSHSRIKPLYNGDNSHQFTLLESQEIKMYSVSYLLNNEILQNHQYLINLNKYKAQLSTIWYDSLN